MSKFLWGVFPYLCGASFFVVPLIRMVYRPFGWSTRASGLFGRASLGAASLLLHWGLGLVLTGHLAGLFGGLLGSEASIQAFYWLGLPGGVMVLVGSLLALWRRVVIPEVRAMSQVDDYLVHLFFIPIVGLALYQVLVHRIFGIAFTASSWFASLFTLSPQPELMASASLLTKLHVALALTFFAYFPFTKLVHAWTYPINYAARPLQSMRTARLRFQRRWELAMRSDKSWLLYGVVTVSAVLISSAALLGRAAHLESSGEPHANGLLHGEALYVSQCARCHGVEGDGGGAGASSPTFGARPRSLVRADYRFVSTDNGVASDDDLLRTMRAGLLASGMPAFDTLTDTQLRSLVSVVRSFQAQRHAPGRPIEVPPRPERSEAELARGERLWAESCVVCHGVRGAGDGALAASLRDGAGAPLPPADLAAGMIKTGRAPEQIYLRIAAGIAGAPGILVMPAFGKLLSPEDIWAIVSYLERAVLPPR